MADTTLDGVTLPPDLEWTDEGAWLPAAAVATVTLTGAQVVQVSALQAGRPITLEAKGDGHVWLTWAEVEALRTMAAANLDTTMVLTLVDGRTFSVVFRHQDGAVEYEPVMFSVSSNTAVRDARPYTLTLRLMQV
jgi:hypothetical protein